jgi:hypothetical protein
VNERGPEFDELFGADLPGEERERLERTHELMLTAGPLPELPLSLQQPPVVEERDDASAAFAFLPRRSGKILTVAAALSVVTLVIGYVIGHNRGGFDTDYSVAMNPTAAAPRAGGVVRVGHIDSVGNWPLEVEVVGLKQLPKGSYYTLYLTKKRKPSVSCGTFRVHEGQTTVRLNAPYHFRSYDGWIVVAHHPGQAKPGPVLLEKYFS